LELAPPTAKTIYVLEMSSFQIDLTPGLHPDVSVLSNLSPDHIDRHGTMENYAAIKARLMKQTARDGQAVIGVDDAYSSGIFTQLSAAGRAQLAERGFGLRRCPPLCVRHEGHCRGHRQLSGLGASHGGCGPYRQDRLHQ